MREIRIHVDPVKLQGYNITLSQITERLKNENIDMVGGRMLTPTRDYIVRTYGEFKSISEIEDLVIRKSSSDAQILLKDVAVVEDLYALQKIRTKYNGHEGVRISIFKQAEANAVEVSDEIARRVQELKIELPEKNRIRISAKSR